MGQEVLPETRKRKNKKQTTEQPSKKRTTDADSEFVQSATNNSENEQPKFKEDPHLSEPTKKKSKKKEKSKEKGKDKDKGKKKKKTKRNQEENNELLTQQTPEQSEKLQLKKKNKKAKREKENEGQHPRQDTNQCEITDPMQTEMQASQTQEKTKKEKNKSKKSKLVKENGIKADQNKEHMMQFRQQNSIHVSLTTDEKEIEEYAPICSFEESPFSKELLMVCSNFEKPTSIQAQCWPIIISGKDIIGIAATGSGKTLAFLLPALMKVIEKRQQSTDHKSKSKSKPKFENGQTEVLILAPTRELALQSAQVCEVAGKHCQIQTVCLYGGVDKEEQRKAVRRGAKVIVATPGRLLDFVNEKCVNLGAVSYLVLDEADRMLDLGFEPDIRAIMSHLPPVGVGRQTVMFSATWTSPTVHRLASEFLFQPIKVTVGSASLSANHCVNQIVEVIDHSAKDTRLDQLLRQYHHSRTNKVLIFALYKKEAARIETMLQRKGWKARAIHGDMSQHERIKALSSFKDGSSPLLIATDVASRGLDIPNVEYVINYTFPLTIEDYVHRIGRTGRAGNHGTAHTFFTSYDRSHAGELFNVLTEANQPVPPELLKFGVAVKKKEHSLYGCHFRDLSESSVPQKRTHVKFD